MACCVRKDKNSKKQQAADGKKPANAFCATVQLHNLTDGDLQTDGLQTDAVPAASSPDLSLLSSSSPPPAPPAAGEAATTASSLQATASTSPPSTPTTAEPGEGGPWEHVHIDVADNVYVADLINYTTFDDGELLRKLEEQARSIQQLTSALNQLQENGNNHEELMTLVATLNDLHRDIQTDAETQAERTNKEFAHLQGVIREMSQKQKRQRQQQQQQQQQEQTQLKQQEQKQQLEPEKQQQQQQQEQQQQRRALNRGCNIL